MPFYPALPEYKPAVQRPFTSLIGGIGAAQEVMGQAAKTQAMREAAQQPARQRAAMEAYQKGDPTQLYTVAPDLAMRLGEDQRKVAASAGDYIMQNAPYIKDPEQYKQFYSDFYKTHPSVSKAMLPSPDKVASPEQVRDILDTGVKNSMALKKQLLGLETEAKVATAKGVYKEATSPQIAQEAAVKERLQGFDQSFKGEQAQLDRDLNKQLADIKLKGDKASHLNYAIETRISAIDTQTQKSVEAIEKTDLPEAQRADQIHLATQLGEWHKDQIRANWSKRAKEFGLPFTYEPQGIVNPVTQRFGPPRGVDPDFDKAITRAGNDPKLRQSVVERWNTLHPKGMDTPETPVAPTPMTAPVTPPPTVASVPPAAPVAAPSKPVAPAATTPQPSPMATKPLVKIPTTPTEYGKATDDEIAELRKQRITEELGGEIDVRGLGYGKDVGKVVDWVLESASRAEREQRKADLEWLRKKQAGK